MCKLETETNNNKGTHMEQHQDKEYKRFFLILLKVILEISYQ